MSSLKRAAEHIGRPSILTGRRLVKWLAILAAFYVVFTATPFADYYSAPLSGGSNPQKSDVIVLLSSGQIDSEWLTPDASQRVLGALKLYREHYAPFIISSGSQYQTGRHQAELQAVWLERSGVPHEAIIVEGHSSRTYESAVEVSKVMTQHAWNSAVIVTSQMDVPRVRLVFRKVGVAASFLAVPEFRKPENFHFFRRAAFDISYHATYEYAALVFYKLKGWI
jgi:uncharacterized SAM-binding protein YcdF (DUF218 family)